MECDVRDMVREVPAVLQSLVLVVVRTLMI